ncbi:hypothetical protein KAR91_25990 [Candidatus Pacearchaeota archaeon]|nr:hypothetical protein [Candidatus Pacearchaeota archaeon]
MKWFKHISVSLDDPFIQDLMDEFGSDGYLVFFGTLEMMSREFNTESPGIVTLPHNFIRRKLRLSWHKISTIYRFCEKEGRFFVTDNGRKITINCPKLKDLCDDWTKKLLRSSLEVTPPKLPPEEEVEVEEEEEVEVDNKKEYKEKSFVQFWELYPKHIARIKVKAKWIKLSTETHNKIFESLSWQVPWWGSKGSSKEFIPDPPNPMTYLNQERWDDERQEVIIKGQGTHHSFNQNDYGETEVPDWMDDPKGGDDK